MDTTTDYTCNYVATIGNVKVCHAVLHVGTGVSSFEDRALLPVPATAVTCQACADRTIYQSKG